MADNFDSQFDDEDFEDDFDENQEDDFEDDYGDDFDDEPDQDFEDEAGYDDSGDQGYDDSGDSYDDSDDNDYDKPVDEGDVVEVEIEDLGSKGDGIARVDGFVVFVPGGEVGENYEVEVTSVGRKFAFAEITD
ncbi:MAG: TRAM domain-containing protein [Candidatus Nanohaloarchaea archaeon]